MKIYSLIFAAMVCGHVCLPSQASHLDNCINELLRKYFRNESVSVFISEDPSICSKAGEQVRSMLKHDKCISFTTKLLPITLFEIGTWEFQPAEKSKGSFIITTGKKWHKLERIMATLKTTSFWNTKVLIVLFNDDDDYQNRAAFRLKVFGEMWRRTRLLHTVLMSVNTARNFSFHTWYPYNKGSCELATRLDYLDTWTPKGFSRNRYLFPKKTILKGLNHCPLHATTISSDFFFPYKDSPSGSSEGLDFLIINELAVKYNMNFKYVFPPPGEDHWTRVFPNGSLQGTMRMLYEYETDFAFSGMKLTTDIIHKLTVSHVYYIDPLRWSVPKVNETQAWKKIFSVFTLHLWLAVLFSFLVSSVLLYSLQKLQRHRGRLDSFPSCLLEVFRLTLTHPTTTVPPSFVLRLFLISYIVYSLNITSCYQSILIGVLTAPLYFNPYNSLEAAFESGLTIYLFPLQIAYYRNDTLGERILRSKQFRMATSTRKIVAEIVRNKTAMLLLGNARVSYLLAKEFHDGYGKPLVDFMPGTVTKNMIAFHFSPNNPLKGLFDSILFRLQQGGFINKWKLDLLTPRTVMVPHDESVTRLKMDHMSSAFRLYIAFICISSAVFLCEIASGPFAKLRPKLMAVLRRKMRILRLTNSETPLLCNRY